MRIFYKIVKLVLIFISLGSIIYANASVTDGTISNTNKSALLCGDDTCATTTQINFKTTNGTPIHVTDSLITGHAWSETFGWINFNPTNGGVDNTPNGVLSGYAWGENAGWINFNPTNGGVTIGTNGKFSGWAWAQNYGWIKFDCNIPNACVETDWRPISQRSNGGGGSSGSSIVGNPSFENPNAEPKLNIDICPNIPGEQNIIPEGLVISSRKECISPIQCNLLDGDLKQPLDVVIAIDRSGSMLDNQKLVKAKQAANDFINNLVPGSDRVSYVTFSDAGVLSTGFSSSFTNTKNKINSTNASGYTNVGGAVKASYNEISNNGRKNVKKVIIILTDGQTNVSDVKNISPVNYAYNEATKAKTDGVVVYTIGLGSDVDANFLKKVASSVKHYYYAPTGNDLANIYLNIAAIECTAAPAKVYDYVYNDTNNNSIKDNIDKGLNEMTLTLTPSNSSLSSRTVNTDKNGKFIFDNVISGDYSLCLDKGDLHQIFPINNCYKIVVIQGLDTTGTYFLLSSNALVLPPDPNKDKDIINDGNLNNQNNNNNGANSSLDNVIDKLKDNITSNGGLGDENSLIDNTINTIIDDTKNIIDNLKEIVNNLINNNDNKRGIPITQVDVEKILNSLRDQIKGLESVTDTLSDISDFMKTSAGELSTAIVTTIGIITGAYVSIATSMFASPISMREIFLIPSRLWGLLLALFGVKKKGMPWGTVYDSVTKQPLDPAYVVLQDLSGNEVSTCITDLDGRYGFLVPPGKYKMIANKTNYEFPSKKLLGKSQDELYQELYFSEEFEVKEGDVVSRNIPMDPIKFDWNEFAKKEKKLMRFFSKRDVWVAMISDILFVLGFFITTVALFLSPNTYNIIVFVFYIILFLFKRTVLKPRPFGNVKNKITDDPLSFAIMRVFYAGSEREITHKVTDMTGKYYCLVPNGNYYVKIENKNEDESYTLVYTSEAMDIDRGFINKKFRV